MKRCLIFITIWSLLLFMLSLIISGVFPFYPADFYRFTAPFMITSFICFVLGFCGLLIKTKRRFLFIISLITFGLLILPHLYAILQWPGDDDGPGMAWALFIGGGSLFAMLFAFFVLMHCLVKKLRIKQL